MSHIPHPTTDDTCEKIRQRITEAILVADFTRTQMLVLLACLQETMVMKEQMLWLSNERLGRKINKDSTKCSTAKNQLIMMNVLIQTGRLIGINSNVYEWNTPAMARGKGGGLFNPFTIDLPHWLPRKLWTDWVTARMDSRKPLDTEAAVKRAIDFLTERWDRGIAPDDVINSSIQHIAYTKAKNAQSHAR